VEHLKLQQANHPLGGIVNQYAEQSSYVNDVTLQNLGGTGILIEAPNSGPYTDIVFIADPNMSSCSGTSCPVCVDIEAQTVHHVVAVPIQSVTVRSKESGKTAEQLKQDNEKQTGLNSSELEKQARKELQRVVFLKDKDKVNLVPVQTGIADNNFIEIRSGARAGDEVVSGSYTAISKDLKDRSKIKIEQPRDAK